MVEIECADKRLKGITPQITVMRRRMAVGENQLVDPHLLGQPVERIALYDLRPCIGEETFAFPREMFVDNVADDGIEDGIAQKFKSFVVYGLSLCITTRYALVQECSLVISDIVWDNADNLVQGQIKLLFLAEREPYSVDNIIQHTS